MYDSDHTALEHVLLAAIQYPEKVPVLLCKGFYFLFRGLRLASRKQTLHDSMTSWGSPKVVMHILHLVSHNLEIHKVILKGIIATLHVLCRPRMPKNLLTAWQPCPYDFSFGDNHMDVSPS